MVPGGQTRARELWESHGNQTTSRARFDGARSASPARSSPSSLLRPVLAAPAEAASEATFDDLVDGSYATVNGNLGSFTAGLMGMTIDGASGAAGYCIDIGTRSTPGRAGWGGRLGHLRRAEPRHRRPDPRRLPPERQRPGRLRDHRHRRPAGRRDAGRHLARDRRLRPHRRRQRPDVEANYAAILAAVDADALPSSGQPDVSLSIASPDVTSGDAGTPVGPYVVSTTASSVTLTPGAGVTVTDGEGVPLAGPIVDGTEFFLLSDVDTTATVTASAEATVHAGRVFVKDGSQRLILATSVDTTVDAEASASWTTPPTTAPPTTAPPTTAPPEPTTTVPEPTSTTVTPPQETSTTLSIQPNPSVIGAPAPAPSTPTPVPTSGSLPRTGNDARPLVAVGLALVAAGAMLGFAARHRRT